MKYTKLPLSIAEQINRLKSRGLVFENDEHTLVWLSNISYYRLRAYTYPFQDNRPEGDHHFIKPVTFEDILELYYFDSKLRLLFFSAIEKIEIAFRTQIIYEYAIEYGSHWPLNSSLFTNLSYFEDHSSSLNKEVTRSNEEFINHYRNKYSDPVDPPCWMSLEVTSMGLLSKIFSNLKKGEVKDKILIHFGLKNIDVLTNWVFCLSILRNTCAHHGRVWNRRFPKIMIPRKTLHSFVNDKGFHPNKLYGYAIAVIYLSDRINPGNDLRKHFNDLLKISRLINDKDMGFPLTWQAEQFWK